MPKGQKIQRAELVMEVMSEEYKGSSIIPVSTAQMITRITDDISTTCYNLLSSLNIKTLQNESGIQVVKPSWIPKIRVEVETIPETNHSNKSAKSEPKKRIIIHNQGTPIIFKFGHDRK